MLQESSPITKKQTGMLTKESKVIIGHDKLRAKAKYICFTNIGGSHCTGFEQ